MKTSVKLLIILPLIVFSCDKKDDEKENKVCFFEEFEPAIIVEDHEFIALDFDKDGKDDIIFHSNPEVFGIEATTSSEEIMTAKGRNVFSGSGVTIYRGDLINTELSWYNSIHLAGTIGDSKYNYVVEYIGIRKKIGENTYYGWIDVYKTDDTFRLEQVFFYKNNEEPVYAGVENEYCNQD
ncbi:MAG TPA: hypothetical protein VLQ91_22405 [Draconibacterium sp.]|nr:hypothetical protein [Draconibacterium sp.]